jgi:hypothetical protein
MKFLL